MHPVRNVQCPNPFEELSPHRSVCTAGWPRCTSALARRPLPWSSSSRCCFAGCRPLPCQPPSCQPLACRPVSCRPSALFCAAWPAVLVRRRCCHRPRGTGFHDDRARRRCSHRSKIAASTRACAVSRCFVSMVVWRVPNMSWLDPNITQLGLLLNRVRSEHYLARFENYLNFSIWRLFVPASAAMFPHLRLCPGMPVAAIPACASLPP